MGLGQGNYTKNRLLFPVTFWGGPVLRNFSIFLCPISSFKIVYRTEGI